MIGTPRAQQGAGLATAGVAVAMLLAGVILQVTAPAEATATLTVGDRVAPAMLAMFALVGAVLVWRRPEHVFGWVMVLFALLQGTNGVSTGVVHGDAATPAIIDVAAWVQSWVWVPAISVLAIGLLLFPDGRLPSRRWRHVLRLELLGLAGTAALAVTLWPHRDPALIDLGDAWPGPAGWLGRQLVLPIVFIGFVAAVVSLIVRYRGATRAVLLQLKWLLLAVTLLVVALASAALADIAGHGDQWWQDLFGVAGLFFLPIAIGVAVLRYRLYEIDRVISRTVSYLLLTGALVGVYALGVVGVGALLPGEPSDLLAAGSTLVVAALFGPLRSRIQAVVDRRFNRSRYDAARTIEAFGARLRDEIDLGSLSVELRGTVATTVQPCSISVWLRQAAG